jgi:Uma2 family endonuclease
MDTNYKGNNFVREVQPVWANNRRYTYGDYLTWEDDRRYEIIDGLVYNMSPAPCRRHQEVIRELVLQIGSFMKGRKCELFFAPFDVRIPENEEADGDIKTVVQPDLVVVYDLEKLDERGYKGAPDLAIEVISPFSAERDRKIKKWLYERAGVKEYWIVDYIEKTVEVFLLNEEGKYNKPEIYTAEDKALFGIFTDLSKTAKKTPSKLCIGWR